MFRKSGHWFSERSCSDNKPKHFPVPPGSRAIAERRAFQKRRSSSAQGRHRTKTGGNGFPVFLRTAFNKLEDLYVFSQKLQYLYA
jgi:hypothetical protein